MVYDVGEIFKQVGMDPYVFHRDGKPSKGFMGALDTNFENALKERSSMISGELP
jgi:hypothetical protein